MKRLGLLLLIAIALIPRFARADGGIVRARETRGPFVITIFTASEVSTAAPTEVSVMVQDRETNLVVTDAVVGLSLVQPDESMRQREASAVASMTGHTMREDSKMMDKRSILRVTRGQGANKLLYSANLVFPTMGDWRMHISVRRDQDDATMDCVLPVALPAGRLAGLWAYLALIPGAIALFALNQWLRRRSANLIALQSAHLNSPTIAAI